SPVPATTTFTTPPPADPSTVSSPSALCAAAMSACIFCIWRIIWLICFWFAMVSTSTRSVARELLHHGRVETRRDQADGVRNNLRRQRGRGYIVGRVIVPGALRGRLHISTLEVVCDDAEREPSPDAFEEGFADGLRGTLEPLAGARREPRR